MPFDANLILADDTADWTYSNLDSYGTPTSTTKNSGGFVVVDMLAFSTTPATGLAAVLFLTEEAAADDDALTVKLQGCDDYDFSSSKVHLLASFEVDAATEGVVIGSETPCTIVRRFTTNLRYLRINASCVSGDDFKTCWCCLAPWPFLVM